MVALDPTAAGAAYILRLTVDGMPPRNAAVHGPNPEQTSDEPRHQPTPESTKTKLTARSAGIGTCSIVSNVGNCYAAGEFCRQRDLGKSTTDADSESIICVMESDRPHWHPTNDGSG